MLVLARSRHCVRQRASLFFGGWLRRQLARSEDAFRLSSYTAPHLRNWPMRGNILPLPACRRFRSRGHFISWGEVPLAVLAGRSFSDERRVRTFLFAGARRATTAVLWPWIYSSLVVGERENSTMLTSDTEIIMLSTSSIGTGSFSSLSHAGS